MTQEHQGAKTPLITVWRDFEHCRAPRLRTNNHKRKLAEFVCHLHGLNYFRRPHRVVTLRPWHVRDETVELWARIRHVIARYETEYGQSPMQPLFLYADIIEEVIPTSANCEAARRDLIAAVGMRAALSRSDQQDDLVFD